MFIYTLGDILGLALFVGVVFLFVVGYVGGCIIDWLGRE